MHLDMSAHEPPPHPALTDVSLDGCRNNDTFARITDALGYVPKEDIFAAVKAIVATQRDYGRRDDRRQARLKYLVQEWGIDRFRTVTEQYYGKKMQPFK